jgi:hypothetical protein
MKRISLLLLLLWIGKAYATVFTVTNAISITRNAANDALVAVVPPDSEPRLHVFPNPFSSAETFTLHRDSLPLGMYFLHLTQRDKVIATGKVVVVD